jgi:hypothetical protein
MGGLGNQLFQIFATIAYAIRNNHRFIFPYSEVLVGGAIRKTYWNNFLKNLILFTTFNSKTGFTNEYLYSLPEITLSFHNYQNIPLIKENESARLYGYFQSFKYFEKEENMIYRIISLEDQLQNVKKENELLFENDYYTISMHFRLGDYKYIQECHNILTYEYYEKSLEQVLNDPFIVMSNKKIRVLYFCEEEDNDFVKLMINKLLARWNTIDFVKVNDKIEDWKQLLIMANCQSNIIANSTYSWWAAYFNRNTNKVVCYPCHWFGVCLNHNYTGDMFPENWKKIIF